MKKMLLFLVLFQGFSAMSHEAEVAKSTMEKNRTFHVVEGKSVTVELAAMPDNYQIEGGYALELFTASADSSFWCGPNKPHPFSNLTLSVICRKRTEFQVLFCSAEGDTIEVLEFVGVEPATYRVNVGKENRPEAGQYILGFRYHGVVVDEFKIQVMNPR